MKSAVVFCFLSVTALALARPDEQYTTQYDNVNVHEVLEVPRLFEAAFKCLVDKGKCTPEMKELRGNVDDALATGCVKCSDKQKELSRIVIKFLINQKPQHWQELNEKYDPQHKYTAMYEKELREIQA